MKLTVPYSEYKNRYEGFEKRKENYNAEEKTIDIEIGDKTYAKLQNRPYAGIILNKISLLIQPNLGNVKQFVLAGSNIVKQFYKDNEDVLIKLNQSDDVKKAIEIMEEWEEAELRVR